MAIRTLSYYWISEKVIPDETCDRIVELPTQWKSAELAGSDVDPVKRSTDVYWSTEKWLYDLFIPYAHLANKESNWNFQITIPEGFQVGKYSEGGHYKWHQDGKGYDRMVYPELPQWHDKSRKISMVLWLNEDFEGGEFEFHGAYCSGGKVIKPTKGTLVMFPAWIVHRVKPVTKGVRYSLVTWFLGEPVV